MVNETESEITHGGSGARLNEIDQSGFEGSRHDSVVEDGSTLPHGDTRPTVQVNQIQSNEIGEAFNQIAEIEGDEGRQQDGEALHDGRAVRRRRRRRDLGIGPFGPSFDVRDAKAAIIGDLDRFVRRREYYKKVGKAWKRGYLLYGPPGTGKSSLIAAMANHLKFDVYDLELTSLYSNAELRRILLATTNKSIIVIEDIDCSPEMHDRDSNYGPSNTKLTLSGLLNFIDGLWSSCGDERIIVFTTNHKDRLDPALLRPGRMDMHIHMSYCTYSGFKLLASNYLDLHGHDHELFEEIKTLIKEVEVTPAQMAEELMKNEDVDGALGGVVDFLKQKKKEASEAVKDEKSDEDSSLDPPPPPTF